MWGEGWIDGGLRREVGVGVGVGGAVPSRLRHLSTLAWHCVQSEVLCPRPSSQSILHGRIAESLDETELLPGTANTTLDGTVAVRVLL